MDEAPDVFQVILFGRLLIKASWASDGAWYIDDAGFCRYRQIASIMWVTGRRPWNGLQFVIGPLLFGLVVVDPGFTLDD